MVAKTAYVFANHHGVPLECDVYTTSDMPPNSLTFLYFHPGGLVDWARDCIPPWLLQICLQRRWALISASYRLLPSVNGEGLLEDARAAYHFAQTWNLPNHEQRHVIVGGASAGFFLAMLIAQHCHPPPHALFSIEGITTFRHRFYNSSQLLTPKTISLDDVRSHIESPVAQGCTPQHLQYLEFGTVNDDGSRNIAYRNDVEGKPASSTDIMRRDMLYEYYTYQNRWLDMVGSVDVEFDRADQSVGKIQQWPPTVVVHGEKDRSVPLGLALEMQACFGKGKVRIVVAKGQDRHLFQLGSFIDNGGLGMDAVREAVSMLDAVIT